MFVRAINLNVIFSFLVSLGAMGCSASTETQASGNMPTDCPTYVLTSTDVSKAVYLSTEQGTAPLFNPYDIKAVETYASSQGDDCNHVGRHLATLDNMGAAFGGVILTGKPYTYILQESEYPLDLTMDEVEVRGAFYDSFKGAITYYIPVGAVFGPLTAELNALNEAELDLDRICTDRGILFSVWSDIKVGPVLELQTPEIVDTKAVMRDLIASCDGGWKYSAKSNTSEPAQRETLLDLFILGLSTDLTQAQQEKLLADREKLSTPGNCPAALEVFSKRGLCVQYNPSPR